MYVASQVTSSEPVRVYCFGEERLLYPETYYESVSGHGKKKSISQGGWGAQFGTINDIIHDHCNAYGIIKSIV